MRLIEKPQVGEYAEYTTMYIDLIPDDGQVLKHLLTNFNKLRNAIMPLSDEALETPHAEGEWTIKDILVHIIDDERIFAYRALRAARNDSTELQGFEQDDYVITAHANNRTLEDIFEEYEAVRIATITLFKYLPEGVFTRQVIGSGNPLSVRSAVYHIAGHEVHHANSIAEHYGISW